MTITFENLYPTFLKYSCFEKGYLTNGERLTWQCRKLLWVMEVFTIAWLNLKVFQRGGRKEHKHVHVFVLCPSLLLNHLKPQSSKALRLLPIIPVGIVAYAFTLLLDNLYRSSCILLWLSLFSGEQQFICPLRIIILIKVIAICISVSTYYLG